MDYEENKGNRERGGIALRDYTKGDPRSLKRSMQQGGLSSALGQINFDQVGRWLIWPSLGLGLMELLMPGRLQRMVGVRRGDYTGLIRLMGLREVFHALYIAAQPRPIRGVWSRVMGDALDLGLLGAGLTTRRANKNRLIAATAVIAGITALDVLTAVQLNRRKEEVKRFSSVTREDLDNRTRSGAFQVTRSITINRSPEELYQYWRNFENLPRFMYHLEAVQVIDDQRSHWVAKAPAGAQVSWHARIIDDRPNELIAWQSLPDATVPNSGMVTFQPHQAGRGTVVRVQIEYRPPGGAVGKVIAALFGEEPGQQVKGDLHRFKQVMETGEVVISEGVPHGFGQKLQRPARPMGEKQQEKLGRYASRQQLEQESERDTLRSTMR